MKTVTIKLTEEQHAEFVEAAKISGSLRDSFAKEALIKESKYILNKNKK